MFRVFTNAASSECRRQRRKACVRTRLGAHLDRGKENRRMLRQRPRVITAADAKRVAPPPGALSELAAVAQAEDPYIAKLIKYIPAEVVATYQFGAGVIAQLPESSRHSTFWWWAGFLFIIAGLWTAYA